MYRAESHYLFAKSICAFYFWYISRFSNCHNMRLNRYSLILVANALGNILESRIRINDVNGDRAFFESTLKITLKIKIAIPKIFSAYFSNFSTFAC